MRHYTLFSYFSILLRLVLAQNLHLDPPQDVTSCRTATFQWSGGHPPYTLIVIGAPEFDMIKEFDNLDGKSVEWFVTVPGGTQLFYEVQGGGGATDASDTFVADGDDSCLNSADSPSPTQHTSSNDASPTGIPSPSTSTIRQTPPTSSQPTKNSNTPSSTDSIPSGASTTNSSTSSTFTPASSPVSSSQNTGAPSSFSTSSASSTPIGATSTGRALTSGIIAGIATGAAFAAAAVIAGVWYLIRRRGKSRRSRHVHLSEETSSRPIQPLDLQSQVPENHGSSTTSDSHVRSDEEKNRIDSTNPFASESLPSSDNPQLSTPAEIQRLIDGGASMTDIVQYILQGVGPSLEDESSDASPPSYHS